MTPNKIILNKIEYLLQLSDDFENSAKPSTIDLGFGPQNTTSYNSEMYAELKNSSKSLILKLFGNEHPYYISVNASLKNFGGIPTLKGTLKAIRSEINEGFLLKLSDLVSAEIFSNFLEMAEYLLKENYKDASAVIIGSTLEEKLRQIASNNGIDVIDSKGNPKKASLLNDDLYKANIYNKLDHKSLISWLELRNNAAHGKYSEYDKKQVEMMLTFVTDFSARIN